MGTISFKDFLKVFEGLPYDFGNKVVNDTSTIFVLNHELQKVDNKLTIDGKVVWLIGLKRKGVIVNYYYTEVVTK